MRFTTALPVLAMLAALFACPDGASAQARAKFSFEGFANCDQPYLRHFPISGEGTGTLSADRSATLDTLSNVEGISTYHATLGGKPTEAPDGSAALKVLGRHSLRAVRDYPNNQLIVDLVVVGKKCTVRIKNVLKPGKHQYTFHTMVGLAYCEAPTITKVSCAPL